MSRKTTDEIAEVEHQLAKAHEARDSADAEYRSYLKAEDMGAVRGARDAMRRHDSEIEVLTDRLEILRQRQADEDQRQADQRLKQATRRAEEAAEAERQAGFELAHIHEQITVLHDNLKAATAEAGAASVRVRQAAEAAGRPVPKSPRSSLKREADIGRMVEAVRRLGRLLDQQEQSAVQASATARKAG